MERGSLGLVLFSDLRLSVALLTGAIGMILAGVLKIDEAYQAVSWKTVFLLASLIPLGLAVETTGTAAWIADQTLSLLGDMPIWVIQAAIAVLATFFTLVMSNVGATVLLVPLAVNIALGAGADPAVFALTVAIATSNSFLIPTHQVNALIMGMTLEEKVSQTLYTAPAVPRPFSARTSWGATSSDATASSAAATPALEDCVTTVTPAPSAASRTRASATGRPSGDVTAA